MPTVSSIACTRCGRFMKPVQTGQYVVTCFGHGPLAEHYQPEWGVGSWRDMQCRKTQKRPEIPHNNQKKSTALADASNAVLV